MKFETIKSRQDILKSRRMAEKTIQGEYVFVIFTRNTLDKIRFLPVVTKKINKRAVIRNKYRRRIKEIFRKMECKDGFDYQIIAKSLISKSDFKGLKKDIEKCFV
ncbi:MAG: ribonuclease P protein component [Rickettsiales bacterium]|jgi:ribonuclease P protein component|nr:ribonuclease P protein component [Rickettsiales bacterium]